ncbi:hypothetical protein ASE85_13585 [Sphingobium sp. Leaf26]|uniref:hypothetical protein n=1 Tax=Sphingobium sp. Leaf26 TaxID=1735693 RepID=UPI0006FE1CEA|nr:hypothetical protein [Sphingobium sp. Leaf26]KQM97900.1 hypothetical protein ASE85_13585 [Sphingobium sp. Leaf26]
MTTTHKTAPLATHSTIARQSPSALFLFLDAVRCWGHARRQQRPTLTSLYARLGHYGCGQMLPAIDSLLDLTVTLLGRPLRLGRGTALSDDENRLINLLQGRRTAPFVHTCSDALLCTFCCALRSVQLLMDMELGQSARRTAA